MPDREWVDDVDEQLAALQFGLEIIGIQHNNLSQAFTDVCAMLHAFALHTQETLTRIFGEEPEEPEEPETGK